MPARGAGAPQLTERRRQQLAGDPALAEQRSRSDAPGRAAGRAIAYIIRTARSKAVVVRGAGYTMLTTSAARSMRRLVAAEKPA